MTVTAAGFAQKAQDVEIRSALGVNVKVGLAVARSTDTVTVEAGADLVENDPIGHTDVDRGLFDKIPLESQSSSMRTLVTQASPGVAADSNGLFHGLGVTRRTPLVWTTSRLPISKARFFPTRFRSIRSSHWKSFLARHPLNTGARRAW